METTLVYVVCSAMTLILVLKFKSTTTSQNQEWIPGLKFAKFSYRSFLLQNSSQKLGLQIESHP